MYFKVCSTCSEFKDLSFFEKRVDSKDGYRQCCRACKNIQAKKAQVVRIDKDSLNYWKLRATSLNSWGGRRTGKAGKTIRSSKPIKGIELEALYSNQPFCRYCKLQLLKENVVFDHKLPLSRDGLHDITNLDIVCKDCNTLKSVRTSEEFEIFLKDYLQRFANPVVS